MLLAWGLLQTGGADDAIRGALEQATSAGVADPPLRGLELFARGTLVARAATMDEVLQVGPVIEPNPAAVPMPQTPALVWRGAVFATTGRFADGVADLVEVTDRIQKGLADVNGGAIHAQLGRAQWFLGRWALARVNFRLAGELSHGYPHPFVVASVPLLAIGTGDDVTATTELRAARELIDRAPWVEAVDLLTITEVIAAHARRTTAPELFDRFRASVRAVREDRIRKNGVWLLHAGIAAIWASELDDAVACAERVKAAPAVIGWTDALADWLLGLVAEALGNGKLALSRLRAALAGDLDQVPLYRGHVLLDHARLAHLLGDAPAAARSLDTATVVYQALGATTYVERAQQLRPPPNRAVSSAAAVALSDREKDVLTLTVEGLSYAQIARDLFITQSTVSYHLGNIYAKANVNSRHQLTDVVRADPALFGLA